MPDKAESETIEIVVNGEARTAPRGVLLLDYLQSLGLDVTRLAVELDRRIVKKPEWASTTLHDGARLEIVHFVGGG